MSANERSERDILSLAGADELSASGEPRTTLKHVLRGCDPLSVLIRGASDLSNAELEIVLLAAFSPEEIASIVDGMLAREAPTPDYTPAPALEESLDQHRSTLQRLDSLLGELPAGGQFAPLPETKD